MVNVHHAQPTTEPCAVNKLYRQQRLEVTKQIENSKSITTLNCKSKSVIYLLECTKCEIQYVGKAETEVNIRLNNHRKDAQKPDVIPASRHFSVKDHNFDTYAKFILIEQIRHINIDKEKIRKG